MSHRCAILCHTGVLYYVTEVCCIVSHRCAILSHTGVLYYVTQVCYIMSQRCGVLSQRCAILCHRGVQYYVTQVCYIMSHKCAILWHIGVLYYVTQVCYIMSQRCGVLSQRCAILCHTGVLYYITVVKLMWICIANLCEHTSNVLPLPIRRCWSPLASPVSQASAPHCKSMDMGWCIVQCVCLLPQLLPGTHSSLLQRAGSDWVGLGPGCLVLHRGSLFVQRRSPTQALTGPSVE